MQSFVQLIFITNKPKPKNITNHHNMFPSYLPHPPNSAWLPPIDPNDEQTLEHEQQMIEQEFRQILNQDMVGTLGPIDLREQQEDDVEEDEQQEEMDQYADQLHSPGDEQI